MKKECCNYSPCRATHSAHSHHQGNKLQGTGLAAPARLPECRRGHAGGPWADGISSRLDSQPHSPFRIAPTLTARLRGRRWGAVDEMRSRLLWFELYLLAALPSPDSPTETPRRAGSPQPATDTHPQGSIPSRERGRRPPLLPGQAGLRLLLGL